MSEDFRTQMRDTLVACGKWFEDNADDLATVMAGGCRSWDISFSWQTGDENDIYPPEIKMSINKLDKGIINAYYGLN